MDKRPDQIEKHIRQQRDELKDNFKELGSKVKDTFDWRTQFHERTGVMLGVAFGGGVLLSALIGGRSSRRAYSPVRQKSLFNESFNPPLRRERTETHRTRSSESWENMKGALVGAVVTKMGAYIERLLPGFQTEYERTQSRPTGPNGSTVQ